MVRLAGLYSSFRITRLSLYLGCKNTTNPWNLSYFSICFDSNLVFLSLIMILRKTLEEIVIQQVADLEQHISVNPVATEDLVDILPWAAQLLTEPSDGAALLLEHFPDEISDVGFFGHGICLVKEPFARSKQRGRNHLSAYLKLKARQSL